MSPALRPGNIPLLESSSTRRRIFSSGATENQEFLTLSIIIEMSPSSSDKTRSQVWLSGYHLLVTAHHLDLDLDLDHLDLLL